MKLIVTLKSELRGTVLRIIIGGLSDPGHVLFSDLINNESISFCNLFLQGSRFQLKPHRRVNGHPIL